MTLFVKNRWKGNTKFTVAEAIQAECDGADYDRGQIETIAATSAKTSQFLGKLVALLHDANVLTEEEILVLLDSWEKT